MGNQRRLHGGGISEVDPSEDWAGESVLGGDGENAAV